MKMRLGIGRAMLGRPRLLILDEPTNGLDPEGTHEVLSFLRAQVRATGLTIFISSHLMTEIEEFCDTVFVINHGRLVASGQVKELLKPHERIVRVTFQGKIPDGDFTSRHPQILKSEAISADTLEFTLAQDDSAWLNQCLLREGFNVSALAPKRKTLKEFFLPSPETKSMRSQFLPLLRNEITKAAHRKLPCFGLGAAALLCVLTFLIGGQISGAATTNAWGYVAFSMQLLFSDIGPIFIIVFASMLISEETGAGTIRAALAAPVNRWELDLAKAALGLLYMMLFSLVSIFCSAALAVVHYRFGAVGDSFGVVYTTSRAMGDLAAQRRPELDSARRPGDVRPAHFHTRAHFRRGGCGWHYGALSGGIHQTPRGH